MQEATRNRIKINIEKQLFAIVTTLFIVRCAGMVMDYTPVKSDDGSKGYFVRTVYGLIDRTKSQAIREIEREANRLC